MDQNLSNFGVISHDVTSTTKRKKQEVSSTKHEFQVEELPHGSNNVQLNKSVKSTVIRDLSSNTIKKGRNTDLNPQIEEHTNGTTKQNKSQIMQADSDQILSPEIVNYRQRKGKKLAQNITQSTITSRRVKNRQASISWVDNQNLKDSNETSFFLQQDQRIHTQADQPDEHLTSPLIPYQRAAAGNVHGVACVAPSSNQTTAQKMSTMFNWQSNASSQKVRKPNGVTSREDLIILNNTTKGLNIQQFSESGNQDQFLAVVYHNNGSMQVQKQKSTVLRSGGKNVIDYRGRQVFRSKNAQTEQFPDSTNEMFDLATRKKMSVDTSISTSVGSTERHKTQLMLQRDHGMTKEQLIARVHKDMQNIIEFMAMSHDKLGNGYAAFIYVIKKTNQQISDRIRKELDKRSYQTFSRKLFSIYRYKISTMQSASKELDQTDLSESQSPERIAKAKGGSKFSSCIHYYKRDLSPIREMFPTCSIKTPYRQNFSNYEANMMSKDFKSSLLKSMGSGVKCIQSTDQNRRLSTYYNKQEICTQKHTTMKQMKLDQFLPDSVQELVTELKSDSSLNSIKQKEDGQQHVQVRRQSVNCVLRAKQSKGLINFDKLPKRTSLSFFKTAQSIEEDEYEEGEYSLEQQQLKDDESISIIEEVGPSEELAAEKDLTLNNFVDDQLDLQFQEDNIDEREANIDKTFDVLSQQDLSEQQTRNITNEQSWQNEEKTAHVVMQPTSPTKLGKKDQQQTSHRIKNGLKTYNNQLPPASSKTQTKKISQLASHQANTQKLNIKIFGQKTEKTNKVVKLNRTSNNVSTSKRGGNTKTSNTGGTTTNSTKTPSQAPQIIAQKDISRNTNLVISNSVNKRNSQSQIVIDPKKPPHQQAAATTTHQGVIKKKMGGQQENSDKYLHDQIIDRQDEDEYRDSISIDNKDLDATDQRVDTTGEIQSPYLNIIDSGNLGSNRGSKSKFTTGHEYAAAKLCAGVNSDTFILKNLSQESQAYNFHHTQNLKTKSILGQAKHSLNISNIHADSLSNKEVKKLDTSQVQDNHSYAIESNQKENSRSQSRDLHIINTTYQGQESDQYQKQSRFNNNKQALSSNNHMPAVKQQQATVNNNNVSTLFSSSNKDNSFQQNYNNRDISCNSNEEYQTSNQIKSKQSPSKSQPKNGKKYLQSSKRVFNYNGNTSIVKNKINSSTDLAQLQLNNSEQQRRQFAMSELILKSSSPNNASRVSGLGNNSMLQIQTTGQVLLAVPAKQKILPKNRKSQSPSAHLNKSVQKNKVIKGEHYNSKITIKNAIGVTQSVDEDIGQQYSQSFYDTKLVQSQYFSQNIPSQTSNEFVSPVKIGQNRAKRVSVASVDTSIPLNQMMSFTTGADEFNHSMRKLEQENTTAMNLMDGNNSFNTTGQSQRNHSQFFNQRLQIQQKKEEKSVNHNINFKNVKMIQSTQIKDMGIGEDSQQSLLSKEHQIISPMRPPSKLNPKNAISMSAFPSNQDQTNYGGVDEINKQRGQQVNSLSDSKDQTLSVRKQSMHVKNTLANLRDLSSISNLEGQRGNMANNSSGFNSGAPSLNHISMAKSNLDNIVRGKNQYSESNTAYQVQNKRKSSNQEGQMLCSPLKESYKIGVLGNKQVKILSKQKRASSKFKKQQIKDTLQQAIGVLPVLDFPSKKL